MQIGFESFQVLLHANILSTGIHTSTFLHVALVKTILGLRITLTNGYIDLYLCLFKIILCFICLVISCLIGEGMITIPSWQGHF